MASVNSVTLVLSDRYRKIFKFTSFFSVDDFVLSVLLDTIQDHNTYKFHQAFVR